MTPRNDDDLLREAFQELRRDARRRGAVPDAAAMLARAREAPASESGADAAASTARAGGPDTAGRTGPGVRQAGWLSLAAAAAVAAVFLLGGPSRADREFERLVADYSADVAGGAWRSPTDALLRTPGLDLGAVPSVGAGLGSLPSSSGGAPENDSGRDS